jgi:hypothetical protein
MTKQSKTKLNTFKKSKKTKKDKTTNKSKKLIKSFKTLKAKITRKSIRKFAIDRINKIVDILPEFVKFYNKLSKDDIIAVKYYKGFGSFFQSELLSGYNIKKNEPLKIEFPFSFYEDNSLKKDILGLKNFNLLPQLKSFDFREIPQYIKNGYTTRIELLNRLDKIYDMKDCPKLTGNEIVFRGMGENNELKKLKIGDTYTFKNFMSTTIDKNIAEQYSRGKCIFIFMGMKNIPFLYMPNSKLINDTKYSKFMLNTSSEWDLSEFTLPRNLEFTIEKIDYNYSFIYNDYGSNNNSKFGKILNILKNKGYVYNDNDGNSVNGINLDEKKNIIEQTVYKKIKYIYCTFKSWHPRTPIIYEDIIKNNTEIVINKWALETWNTNNNPNRIDGFIP